MMRKAAAFIAAVSVTVCAGAATSGALTSLPRLLRADGGSKFAARPATISFGCCERLVIGGPGASSAAFRSGSRGHIFWKRWRSSSAIGTGLLWVDNCVPRCASGAFHSVEVSIRASGVQHGRYTRLLLIYRSGGRWKFDRRTLERLDPSRRPAFQWSVVAAGASKPRGPVPRAMTVAASTIDQTSATANGTVNPRGQTTTYYFQYGTASYASHTASQAAGSGRTARNVSANLTGLGVGTTYHYRLVATDCGGCRSGTSYGSDQTFITVSSTEQASANRALATYDAMQKYFYARSVYPGNTSSLYTESYPQSGKRYSFLWPFSRALAGTITLSGIPSTLLGGASYQPDVADRLTGLSRYWDSTSSGPGYDSYPPAPYGDGGDKYYDDQAWIGLAAAQNYALSGDPTSLADAENVFNFVYPGGWAGSASFEPGGVHWVQQGTGVGATNHSRTTNATAPNAETALLLEGFDPANAAVYDAGASNMYGWTNHYLYNVNTNPTEPSGPNPNYDPNMPALMFDSVTTDNTISEALYTYNQGAMIAANVREYQKTGNPGYLQNAEAIANTALDYWSESNYINNQSAAFNAIFFRGLLVLYPFDTALQPKIIQTIQTFADDAWNNHRNADGLFRFPTSQGTGNQLLDQGAMLQIYAMLAWNPSDYGKLP